MNKRLLLIGTITTLLNVNINAQSQIENSDFEEWETTTNETDEPVNWNSFTTASDVGIGQFDFGGQIAYAAATASTQLEKSTEVRPGSSGSYSAKIFAKQIVGITANGNLTIGRINVGSTTADDYTLNYNYTDRSTTDHSEAFSQQPDSMVFWVKMTAVDPTHRGKVNAVLHSDLDYQDPGGSDSEIVGEATAYFTSNANWQRISVPFNYGSPYTASTVSYILLTATTNETPAVGAENDELLLDDIEMIYNTPLSINDKVLNADIYSYNGSININLLSNQVNTTAVEIIDLTGKTILRKNIYNKNNSFKVNVPSNIYFVRLINENGIITKKIRI